MEGGGKQSRLLNRLLGKLRGEHRYSGLEKYSSFSSTGLNESTECESMTNEEDSDTPQMPYTPPQTTSSNTKFDDEQFAANIDLRYGGQYLTPEQLPEFCDQLHNLVQVIRNIQSYAKVTGEYPSTLEHRLQQEAQEVAVLAAEARNARDVVMRTRAQRRALRAQRKHLIAHLETLRETEIRELESTVRISDRKLFKSWEGLKESTDPSDFEPLLEEIKDKQSTLECLVRLIEGRRAAIALNSPPTAPQPLPPPPLPRNNNATTWAQRSDFHNQDSTTAASASNGFRREGGRRANPKRRRKDGSREPRSVPLSGEPSQHGSQPPPQPQVTLFIQGPEHSSRYRVGSAGAVALTPLELSARGSVRDILFFTSS